MRCTVVKSIFIFFKKIINALSDLKFIPNDVTHILQWQGAMDAADAVVKQIKEEEMLPIKKVCVAGWRGSPESRVVDILANNSALVYDATNLEKEQEEQIDCLIVHLEGNLVGNSGCLPKYFSQEDRLPLASADITPLTYLLIPGIALISGPLRHCQMGQQRHRCSHPRDSLGLWPIATPPNGLHKLHRHRCSHPRDSLKLRAHCTSSFICKEYSTNRPRTNLPKRIGREQHACYNNNISEPVGVDTDYSINTQKFDRSTKRRQTQPFSKPWSLK